MSQDYLFLNFSVTFKFILFRISSINVIYFDETLGYIFNTGSNDNH